MKLEDGVHGKAYAFDGILSNAELVKDGPDLSKMGLKQISVSSWFKPQGIPNYYSMLFKNSFRLEGMNIRMAGADEVTLSTAMEWNFLRAKGVILGGWNHVVATNDGTKAQLWLNGKLAQERPYAGTLKLSKSTILGLRHSYGLKGLIDDVRIHSYALSPAEIKDLIGDKGRQIITAGKADKTAAAAVKRLQEPYRQPLTDCVPLAKVEEVDGRIELPGTEAWLESHILSISANGEIGHWTMGSNVHWKFKVTDPGVYEVYIKQSAIDRYRGSEYDLIVGKQVLKGKVESTSHWGIFKSVKVGKITFDKPGTYILTIRPTSAAVWVMNSKGVDLVRIPLKQ